MSFSSQNYLENYISQHKDQYNTPEQIAQLSKIQNYLTANKIDALFNEIVVDVTFKRPEDVKAGFLSVLKRLKSGDRFFKKFDFEDMFENYNFFEDRNRNKVHVDNLVQCLSNINLEIDLEALKKKYNELEGITHLDKKLFVSVLEKEYK